MAKMTLADKIKRLDAKMRQAESGMIQATTPLITASLDVLYVTNPTAYHSAGRVQEIANRLMQKTLWGSGLDYVTPVLEHLAKEEKIECKQEDGTQVYRGSGNLLTELAERGNNQSTS